MEIKKFKEENIIGYDFEGWPIEKLSLRDILTELGFEEISNEGNKYFRIRSDNKVLDAIPKLFEDDGMGYLVNEEYITDVWTDEDSNVSFVRDKIHINEKGNE